MNVSDRTAPAQRLHRGSALIMVVITLFLVMLILSAIYAASRQNLLNANDKYWADKAGFASRAGIEYAIATLASNPYICAHDPATIPADYVGAIRPAPNLVTGHPLEGDPDVTFDVQMRLNNTSDPLEVEGVMVPPKVTWVRSTGNLRDRTTTETSSLVRLIGPQAPVFKQSIVGLNSIIVDSTSAVKAWSNPTDAPRPSGGPVVIGAPPRRGDLATNSTAPNAIKIDGTVWGIVRAGVGTAEGTVNTVVTGSASPLEGKLIAEEAIRVPRFILDNSEPENYPFKLALSGPDPSITPAPAADLAYRPLRRLGAADVDVGACLPPGVIVNGAAPNHKVIPAGIGAAIPKPLPPEHREGSSVPAPGSNNQLTHILPGRYDLTDKNGGSVWIENAVFRRNAPYYFNGDVTLAGKICADPGLVTDDKVLGAVVIYVNGNVTIQDGAEINWDRYDLEQDPATDLFIAPGDSLTDEPLPARNFQLYTLMNNSEDIVPRTVVIGQGGVNRPKVSMVACGPRMNITLNKALYYGGIQGFDVALTNGTELFFDTALYGVPLEGQGQTSVLLSSRIRYAAPLGGGGTGGGGTPDPDPWGGGDPYYYAPY